MKTLLTTGLALTLAAGPAPALAQVPDTSPATIALIAKSCTPTSAFGFDIGQRYDGGRMRQLEAGLGPFGSAEVLATQRSKTLFGVDLWGYHPDDAGTAEERRAGATLLLDQLDAAVEESGLFASRTWDEEAETILYTEPVSDPESKVQLELSQLGVSVIASCADQSLRQLAFDEAFGRTRVDRPVRPDLPAPARVDAAECDDPVRAEARYDSFEAGGGADVANAMRASQEYFEHLTQWYGQELIDRGVWTEQDRDAFLMSFLEDEVIMQGLEEQMGRLTPLLETTMQIADMRDAGDSVGSCRGAASLILLLEEIGRANEVQWDRATALYNAEAARLGVTLD
ncbi:hypothetical protein [Brevundimonas sp.]|uniref:hypothetical protein n=1 Tax=Brevundimonas sp. TaxID=1871086 RepID=UPI002D742FA3|nr:hypothetical protein [Brevundimonas sp.]HYC99523.1 hypothetical protein [Brevundimonas sp.]